MSDIQVTNDTKKVDPSKYIRTYAKDFSALSGKPPSMTEGAAVPTPSAPVVNVPQMKPPPPPERKTFQEPDPSFVTTEEPPHDPLDLNELQKRAEKIDTSSKQEEGFSLNAPQETVEERAAILARLKAKVQQEKTVPNAFPADTITERTPFQMSPVNVKIPIIEPVVLPTVHIPEPVAARPLEAKPVPEVVPPPLPQASMAPPPPPVPPVFPTVGTSAPIHTYKSDFADHIDQQHASTFSVLAAEKDTQPRPHATTKQHRGLLPIIAGIVLILAGGIGALAAYNYMHKHAPVPLAPSVPSLVAPDETTILSGSGNELMQEFAGLESKTLPDNSILVANYETQSGTTQTLEPGGDLLNALNLPAPDILLRNIDPSSTLGVVQVGNQTGAFFILRVTSYERTFAGMLQWESTMQHDLASLYPLYPAPPYNPPPVTASSSASYVIPTQPQADAEFVDEIIDNHNVRELKDTSGNTLIVYGYADKQTLVIARNEASFVVLVDRLQANGQ